jgi:hypothetical protein
MRAPASPQPRLALVVAALIAAAAAITHTSGPSADGFQTGLIEQALGRILIAEHASARPVHRRLAARRTPAERRAAIDGMWGEGPSTADKLKTFDTFWQYVDAQFAAFHHLDVNWNAMRDRYRGEVAGGVSRGRFAAIINQLALAVRDSHTIPLDAAVNLFTIPGRGVPLLGLSGWTFDPSGVCATAQPDGSSLVYSAMPDHPLGLEPGDRVLGYDGRSWRRLYRRLLDEELPLWPLWWGTAPSAFEHAFVMAAPMNWGHFETMDVLKFGTGQVEHVPTAGMPDEPLFWGFCSEQIDVSGIEKPTTLYEGDDMVSAGIIPGTRIGYIYIWSWFGTAADEFAEAVEQLTQVEQVEGLIVDLRFNVGGFLNAPFEGLGALSSRPTPTVGMDQRKRPQDHLAMRHYAGRSEFKLDFVYTNEGSTRVRASFDGPVAVLVGPGAVSAGDFASLWAMHLPWVRSFGKSSAMALGLPTQPALGTSLDLGPDWWFSTVSETNSHLVGSPRNYLIHTEFPLDEVVWLRPQDVAQGQDTVVNAARAWLTSQLGH